MRYQLLLDNFCRSALFSGHYCSNEKPDMENFHFNYFEFLGFWYISKLDIIKRREFRTFNFFPGDIATFFLLQLG